MNTHDDPTNDPHSRDSVEHTLDQWHVPATPHWLAARGLARLNARTDGVHSHWLRPALAVSIAASLFLGTAAGWVAPLPPTAEIEVADFTW